MTAALFEGDVDQDAEHRQIRQLALGGALQLIRTRRDWNVNEAAAHAGIAPMTWRRMEDGMSVRTASHAAVDKLLGLHLGTVKRALNDDWMMVDQIIRLTGTDIRSVAADNAGAFLAEFARTTRSGSPQQQGAVQRLFTDPGALRIMSNPDGTVDVIDEHGQARAWQPRDLRLVGELIELLQPLEGKGSEPIDELLSALVAALPDLVQTTVHFGKGTATLGGLDAQAGGVSNETPAAGGEG